MAIDEAILTACQENRVPPTLRFYGWSPAALTIGYFQQAEREVDFEALRRAGIGFVRRPTGGRAVLHDRELTYSIVVSESFPGIPGGIEEACRVLSEGLLRGYRRLGLDARVSGEAAPGAAATADPIELPASSPSSACFDAPSRYELTLEGRKLAGSSQLRAKGVLLQHGSVPWALDAALLFDVLRFGDETERQRKKRVFLRKAAAIGDFIPAGNLPSDPMPVMEEVFAAGFREGLNVELVPGGLTEFETELAARLAVDKYGSDQWNFRR